MRRSLFQGVSPCLKKRIFIFSSIIPYGFCGIVRNRAIFGKALKMLKRMGYAIIGLKGHLEMGNLLLASASPRRRRILRGMGYDFDACSVSATEKNESDDPARLVAGNALSKNSEARRLFPDKHILSSDTIVWFGGRAIGKPKDMEDAAALLRSYSGLEQSVYTAVAFSSPGKKPVMGIEASIVRFKTITEKIAIEYARAVSPLDRAGAYDIGEHGDMIIEDFSGDISNIEGLPINLTRNLLSSMPLSMDDLLKAAAMAAEKSYSGYSQFPVGAAILTDAGKLYTGCNIENSSYGLSICAERVAAAKAASDGARAFKAVAIAGGRDRIAYPCGACRQFLSEFCGPQTRVVCANLSLSKIERFTLGELLPASFSL